jgi:hypothetical protein
LACAARPYVARRARAPFRDLCNAHRKTGSTRSSRLPKFSFTISLPGEDQRGAKFRVGAFQVSHKEVIGCLE